MNKEFGHWDLLCDEPTTWESFVYLMIDTNGKMYIDTATTQRYYTDGAAITFNMGNTEYTHLTRDQKYFEYHIGAWKCEGRAERGI